MSTTEQLRLDGAFIEPTVPGSSLGKAGPEPMHGMHTSQRHQAPPPLRRDETGVSPVIGIVLMVAITVTLAATVFVAIGGMDKGASPTPQAAFQSDRAGPGGNVMVLQVGTMAIHVADITVNPSNCMLKDPAGNDKTTGQLGAADYFACPDDGSVVIVDNGSGTVIFSGNV